MKFLFLLLVFSLHSLQADMTAGEMLMKAAALGDLKTVESLLSAGFNPNLPLRGGETPLSIAVQLGNTSVLELLLAWHADPNSPISSVDDYRLKAGRILWRLKVALRLKPSEAWSG